MKIRSLTRGSRAVVLITALSTAALIGTGAVASASGGHGQAPSAGKAGSSTVSPLAPSHHVPAAKVMRPPRHNKAGGGDASLPAPNTSGPYMYNQKNGPVQTDPRIYVVYWGNWSGDTYGVASRLRSFFNGIGSSGQGGVLSQYQQGCTAGTWNCTGAHAGAPSAPFKSYWNDTSFVPTTPTAADMQAEVRRAASVFGDYTGNAQYVIALPRGHGDSQFVAKGGDACAWHNYMWLSSSQWVTYTSLPYMPDAPNCFMNWVNSGSAGTLDGVSAVAGHEYAESVTDPGVNAWYDVYGAENGDKCNTYLANISTSTGVFPMEATWSNYHKYYFGAGCAFRW